MSFRNGPALEELINTWDGTRKLFPREIQQHEKLNAIEKEKTTTRDENKLLKQELKMVENEISALETKEEVDKQDFDEELRLILFDYLPSHPYNYSHAIGPVNYDIAETDTTIGIYDIGKHLGEGNYASVYIGTNRRSQQQYALKKLSKNRMVSLRSLTQLEKELDVLHSVNHENIIKLHDTIHAPDHIYLVLELGHVDLFKYIKLHGLALDTIREIALGLLRGVAYLHERGIAHLDIKEENILIAKDVTVLELNHTHIKLCDLGLCAVQPDVDQPIPVSRLRGTSGYFAPEIVSHMQSAEGRSADMWSVGATLIGLVQEDSPSWMDAYSYFKSDRRKFQEGLVDCVIKLYERKFFPDIDLHDLICRMLVMKPSKRLTAAQALEHVWIQRSAYISKDYQDYQKRPCTKYDDNLPSWYNVGQRRWSL
jgi:serine/threonine protein kinase